METRKRKIESLRNEVERLEQSLANVRRRYEKAEGGISLIEFIGCGEDNGELIADILGSECIFFREKVSGWYFRTEYACDRDDVLFIHKERKNRMTMRIGSHEVSDRVDRISVYQLCEQMKDADSWEGGNIPPLWKEIHDPELDEDWNEDDWQNRLYDEWQRMVTCASESVKDGSKYRSLKDIGLKKGVIMSMMLYNKCLGK